MSYYYYNSQLKKLSGDLSSKKQKIENEIEMHRKELLLESKDKAFQITQEAVKEEKERKVKLDKREEKLEQKDSTLNQRINKLEEAKEMLEQKNKSIDDRLAKVNQLKDEEEIKLEKISGLSRDEAKETLFQRIEETMSEDLLRKVKIAEDQAKKNVDKKVSTILTNAVQRCSVENIAEKSLTTINLSSDDIKGRIIGREGRNINAFERVSGVDLIIDDTPDTIIVSCFNPVRRYIAKHALTNLIEDGRIHPGRIEEEIKKSQEYVGKIIQEFGERAVQEVGLHDVHPSLVKLLGRLRFRTSYGQNVLKHSIEAAFIAEHIAAEIGINAKLAKKAALFHDIGKAVDHEIQGSHDEIGAEIAQKFNLEKEVINTIAGHHDRIPMEYPEAICAATAEAISAARPGARRETVEIYAQRLRELENIANSYEGVKKAYAIQAGHELRIIVDPNNINDLDSKKLSMDIARQIETSMTYPGQVKVNVIRELRFADYAK